MKAFLQILIKIWGNQDFCEELEYWGLDDLHMEPCCQHSYYRARWLLPEKEDEVSALLKITSVNELEKIHD
jgi:hypothetical protein